VLASASFLCHTNGDSASAFQPSFPTPRTAVSTEELAGPPSPSRKSRKSPASESDPWRKAPALPLELLKRLRDPGVTEGKSKARCDRNVIVPCSKQVNVDQDGSEFCSGKQLKDHVEWRIFTTDQNTPCDLQNRGRDTSSECVSPCCFPLRRRLEVGF
jgi:hypothetical protein